MTLPKRKQEHLQHRPVPRTYTGMRCRQVFPGVPVQVRRLRHWLVELLPDCPAREDVVTIAVEYATNAIQHTTSGRQGGYFVAELTWYGSTVRIAVADGGGPNEPRVLDPSGDGGGDHHEHGRGLWLVKELSVRTGVIGGPHGRVMWAEVPWLDGPAPPAAMLEQIHEEAIATQERTCVNASVTS